MKLKWGSAPEYEELDYFKTDKIASLSFMP